LQALCRKGLWRLAAGRRSNDLRFSFLQLCV
jgi:hypothetical protein